DKDQAGGIFRFTARDLRYSAPQGPTADSRVLAGNGRESACVGIEVAWLLVISHDSQADAVKEDSIGEVIRAGV
ncbi:hypothetical protein MKX07_006741, partial [Trichoderma sp. CBMAI-0711]